MAQGTAAHYTHRPPLTGTGSGNHFRLGEWKIGTLLTACFAAIVLLMIVGDVIAVLQLERVEKRAWQFYQADQKSLAIMHVYLDVVSFRDTMTGLAHDQNPHEFASRASALRDNFLRDVTQAQRTLGSAPEVSQDPTILIRLETVRAALPSQVDTMLELVRVEDWQPVRFRLAGQVPPLIGLSSSLVADVEQEVAQERAQALESLQRTRRELYLVLPVTALLILLMAAMLGWYATRRISKPLLQLDAGVQALARGEFGYQVGFRGNDELADLARAFNYASQQLHRLYDDIKRSEAYLAESNAKLEEAQRITHVGYWEWDLATDSLIWSDETYRIFGLRPQERRMNVDALRGMIHPEDRERVFREKEQTLTSGVCYDVEHGIVRPSGEVRVLNSRRAVKKDESGRPTHFYGTVQDITDRKRAEDAVRKSENELREVIDTIPAIVWSVLPDGSNAYVNRRFIEYTGMSADQSGGSGWQAAIHPDDLDRHKGKWMEAVAATSEPFELDARLLGKDGIYRWFLFRYNPLVEEGHATRWYASATEIELRKREEDRVRQENVRLEERTRIAQELHDTLLQTFLSASMQMHVALDSVGPNLVVKPQLDRILQIMNQGIEEGRITIRGLRSSSSQTFDLALALSGVPQELETESKTDFRMTVAGRQRPLRPSIQHETYRIGREALVNAFCHSGAERIELELEYADSELRMRVRDNGCGIDSEVLRAGREGHWGLAGMRERATRIGGLLKIFSSSTGGTEVQLSVPSDVAFQVSATDQPC